MRHPPTFNSSQQRGDVALQRLLPAASSGRKRLVRRSVVVAEHLHEVRGRQIAKVEKPPLAADLRACAEQFSDDAPRCPTSAGDFTPAGGGTCAPIILNSWPMKPSRRPVRHSDAAAAAQHNAQHFVRSAFVVRREHRAERRQHDVEARVVERQIFGIGLTKLHAQPFGARTLAAFVEQSRHVIGRRDVREAARSGERGVAVAGSDVEHAFTGAHIGGFGERLADDLQRGADDGVIAAGPGRLLALLDRGEVGVVAGVSRTAAH